LRPTTVITFDIADTLNRRGNTTASARMARDACARCLGLRSGRGSKLRHEDFRGAAPVALSECIPSDTSMMRVLPVNRTQAVDPSAARVGAHGRSLIWLRSPDSHTSRQRVDTGIVTEMTRTDLTTGIMAQAPLQPRARPRRKQIWRKRRPGDPPHYSVTVGGEGHWQPSKTLRSLGFSNKACGSDGPEARAIAENMNRVAGATRAAVDAAQASMDVAHSYPRAIYPYAMLRCWSTGNAARLQHLQHLQRREFEESLKLQTDQTHQLRSAMRLQTRPPVASLVSRLRAALNTMFYRNFLRRNTSPLIRRIARH
jgi:hypothetical protein